VACVKKARASKPCAWRSRSQTESCGAAIPKVAIAKDANYWDEDGTGDPEAEVDLIAMIEHMLKTTPLAGFVVEGLTPYGRNVSNARHRLMLRAIHSGLPVVRVGRGTS